jgi:hypothetical protein
MFESNIAFARDKDINEVRRTPERYACKVVMGDGQVEYGMFSKDEIKHMLENTELGGSPPYFVQL